MIRPTVRIVGTQAMVKNLKRASKKTQNKARDVVLSTAWLVHNQAKYFCPVDTGRLRGSISVNWPGSGMDRGKVTGIAQVDDGVGSPEGAIPGFCAATGTNVEYAEPVEDRSPYLWPAFSMNRQQFMIMMAAALKMELETI